MASGIYNEMVELMELLQELEQDIFVKEKFEKLTTYNERVDLAYSWYTKKNPGDRDSFFPEREEKSDIESLRLREKGNEMFRVKKSLEALQLYTESIAYAENGGSHLGVAYANRSAVLFEKGYYKECLEDIERALQNHYPNHLKEKLLKRQNRAKILQTKNPKTIRYYKPVPSIVNKHPRISAAADCLELKRNETFGTHVVTTRDVKPGEIICVEKPYVHAILPESRFLNCHECLELCFNMIPCEKCATALYCSTTCKMNALRSYHRYECAFGGSMEHDYIVLKTAILSAPEFKNFKRNGSDNLYRSDRYKEFYDLKTNEKILDNDDYYMYAANAGIMLYCLKKRTRFLEENHLDDNTLKNLLLRNLLIENANTVKIIKNTSIPDTIEIDCTPVGKAIYTFFSRFNHSCAPNCQYMFRGTNLIVRANGNIKKGEQCFVRYGQDYITHNYFMRRAFLKRFFYFTCRCVACENFWPSYHTMTLDDVIEALTDTRKYTESAGIWPTIQLWHILQIVTRDITDIDKEKLLSISFKLKDAFPEPSKVGAFIRELIFRLILFSGNNEQDF